MSMVVGIDYTASNGNQATPNSLHALNNNNQYQNAIYACGAILEQYDYDKSFPVFGFGGVCGGGMPCATGTTDFCFPVNGNRAQPEIQGVANIVMAY